MESNFIIPTISCPTHSNEPVIRVSLDLNEEKLFFCCDCLEQTNNKSHLVKFQDVIPKLLDQYSSQVSIAASSCSTTNLSNLLADQNEFYAEFSDHICQQKDKSDNESDKIQKQVSKLLQRVRIGTYEKLDQFGKSFNKLYDEYSHTIHAYQELLSNLSKDVPTQNELELKIFNTESTKEAEKNLREVLADLKTLKDIKEGAALEKIKKMKFKLEEAAGASLIPEKNEKQYASKIKILGIYFEALVAGGKKEEQNSEETEGEIETERQKQVSENLICVLEDLGKKIESSNQKIDALLEEIFEVKVFEAACSVSKNGSESVNAKAYKCHTCYTKYQLTARDLVCEGCKDVCHKGHQVEFRETKDFVCQCQFTMRDCKLAVSCTYKYTGRSFVKQAYFLCKTDRMRYGNCICVFCMNNCHKGHELTYSGTGSAFCDCQSLFPFCKFHTGKCHEEYQAFVKIDVRLGVYFLENTFVCNFQSFKQ